MSRRLPALLLIGVAVALVYWLQLSGPGRSGGGVGLPDEDSAGTPRLVGSGRRSSTAVTDSPHTVSQTGRVVDANRSPVAGALLWASAQDRDTEEGLLELGRTDEDGSYSITAMTQGARLLVGFADGKRVEVPKPRDPDGAVTVVLGHVRALEGTVRDSAGEPVASARVRVWGYPFGEAETTSLADGTFRVPVPARDEFRLRAEGFDRGRLTRYGLYWAEETKLDLVLPAVFTIRGRVVREDGAGSRIGVPGVRVVAWALEHAYYGGESAHGSITAGDGVLTAADGTFMYPGVVQCYEFRIDTDAWYLAEESARWRDGTEPVIVVRPRAAVAGRVVDESGKGVPFAEVWGGR